MTCKQSIIDNWKNYIENNLLPIVKDCGNTMEGNIYSRNYEFDRSDLLNQKQENFVKVITENLEKKKILEIGFNAGYSSLLMLMSNPDIEMLCVDINDHKYTKPCYEKIKEDFDNITLITESSLVALPNLIEYHNIYDIIHVDGGHNQDIVQKDVDNSLKLCESGSLLIVDDTNMAHINKICNNLVDNNIVKQYLKQSNGRYKHSVLEVL